MTSTAVDGEHVTVSSALQPPEAGEKKSNSTLEPERRTHHNLSAWKYGKCVRGWASVVEYEAFLDRMTGRWHLSGEMGDIPLRQDVQAEWVLGSLYVEMRCR